MARVAALLVGICLLAGCDGDLEIYGLVLDRDGAPVHGAHVEQPDVTLRLGGRILPATTSPSPETPK
jgi:hypothetical protein